MTWALVELYDDGDPSDHARVSKVRVFNDLRQLRAVLQVLIDTDKLRPDVDPFDLENDELTIEDLRAEPEQVDWLDTSGDDDDGWQGGRIYSVETVNEVE